MTSWQRYVALGDSTTEGLFDGTEEAGYVGFADRLARHIAAAQATPLLYANLGVRGRKVREVKSEQLPVALAMRPDLATVVAGINDVLRVTADLRATGRDLAEVFAALTAAGATVATFTFPDLSAVMPLARLLRPRLRALNTHILNAAAEHGVLVADLRGHPFSADRRYWHDDRLHGSSSGHRVVAAALAAELHVPTAPPPAPPPGPSLRRSFRQEVHWAQTHLMDYLSRHARGVKLGHGRAAKRPTLTPMPCRIDDPKLSPRESGSSAH